ncbi:hypothetical protein G9A89_015028 [Geosiphon pyriformis]|nr:hypothetical protein G9A89_015028 [Geosiphon pyriformis]
MMSYNIKKKGINYDKKRPFEENHYDDMDVAEQDESDIIMTDDELESSENDPDEKLETINVDAEFFDPQPIDFHAIKSLLTQLFSSDAELFNISELTDLILGQPLLGTTVKFDGSQSDPFALLTVLNLNEHKSKSSIQSLVNYLLEKVQTNSELHQKLVSVLDHDSNENIGLILSERMLNMPVQIVPHMYKMLMEEIQWAVNDKEPYNFEWYLIITKTYREIRSSIPDFENEDAPSGHAPSSFQQKHRQKKKKKESSEPKTFYFHPEDEIIEQNADYTHDFQLSKKPAESDSRRAFHDFGITPAMKLFLIHCKKLAKMTDELEAAC